jgi:Flp pilus assembly protein TadD
MKVATAVRLLGVLLALTLSAGCTTGPSSAAKQEIDREELLAAFEGLDPEEILQAGDAAAAAGDTERALFIYNQALVLENSADAWFRVGHVYWELEKEPQAWRAYATALQLDPDHAQSHEEIGLLHMAMKQQEPAEKHLRRAIELSPSTWRAHNALGVMADVRKDYATAIYHYNAALEANPESAVLLNNLGYSHYLAGNYGEAEMILRMAVGIDPDYTPAVANLGLSHARRRDYAEAVEILKQVMDSSRAHNDVGFVAYHNGDLEDAAWLLTEAIRLSPTYYEVARNNLRKVRNAIDAEIDSGDQKQFASYGAASDVDADDNGMDPRTVDADMLNVRSAASRESTIVGRIGKGKEVQVSYEQNGWAFIEYWNEDGAGRQVGWVRTDYLASEVAQVAEAA